MKVLLLGKYSLPRNGGVERHLDSLFQGFHAIGGVDASLLTANDGWGTRIENWNGFTTVAASRIADINRLPVARLYPRSLANLSDTLAITPGYARWLRRMADVDVIHVHAPNPLAEMALRTVRTTAPIVVTEHCAIPSNVPLSDVYRRWHQRLLDRADAIIVQSEPFRRSAALTDAQRAIATVIPSSLDPARFQSTAAGLERARAITAGVEGPVVLFVGRLVDYKGLDFLVEAMASAPGSLFVVGVGPEERRARVLAQRHGVADRVRILGSVDDETVTSLMQVADVLVLPSTDDREGYGLVLLEAHIMGTPTISTELGTGTSWVNQNGVTGLVVPPRDAGALARGIQHVAENPDEARAWGVAARARATAEFSHTAQARRTLGVYEAVVAGSRTRR